MPFYGCRDYHSSILDIVFEWMYKRELVRSSDGDIVELYQLAHYLQLAEFKNVLVEHLKAQLDPMGNVAVVSLIVAGSAL